MFNTLETHTINPDELRKRKEAELKAENDAIAEKVAKSLAASKAEEEKKKAEEEIQVLEVLSN